jgi:hypothetical protein
LLKKSQNVTLAPHKLAYFHGAATFVRRVPGQEYPGFIDAPGANPDVTADVCRGGLVCLVLLEERARADGASAIKLAGSAQEGNVLFPPRAIVGNLRIQHIVMHEEDVFVHFVRPKLERVFMQRERLVSIDFVWFCLVWEPG